MKKILLFLFLSFNFIFSKDLLWKLENNNATLFITGSINYGREDFLPLPSALDSAFNISDHLVVEMDLDAMRRQGAKLSKLMMLPPGETFEKRINEKSVEILKEYTEQTTLPYDKIQRMKPWAAAMSISRQNLQMKGIYPGLGLENYFFEKAQVSNKEILHLMDPTTQVELFQSLDKYDNEFVLRTFQTMENEIDNFKEIINAWKKADLNKIDKLINEDLNNEKYKDLNNKLVYEKNIQFMNKLETFINSDKTYFVVLDVENLVGDEGLINLLSKKYDIKQL